MGGMTSVGRMRKALGLVLLIAAASTGCAVSAAPFGGPEDSYAEDSFQDPRNPGLLRIAITCRGDLFPDPREVHLDARRFGECRFSLRRYYNEVLKRPYDADSVARRLAARIRRVLQDRPLMVLIHGINNTYGTARRSYKLARLQVEDRFRNRKFAYLEVYWDGYYGDPVPVWGQAKSSSLRAGLGLRRLLNRLDPRTPIRVLTHSRGAAVIASALWNFPMDSRHPEIDAYRAAQESVPTPDQLLDVRVGMLVPAMGADAFDSYFDRTPGRGRPAVHDRIILGINEDDPAVGKGLLPSWTFGSTELGCNPALFDSAVKPVLKGAASLVDFSACDIHDFKEYLLRRPFEESFLPLLLENGRTVASN